MIRSSLLTPFRWYDDFHEQDRFSRECSDMCPFELITDINHLLPFQVKRPASGYTVDNWILRKACTSPFGEGLIPKGASSFIRKDYWTRFNWAITGGHAEPVSNAIAGSLVRLNVLTPGKNYKIVFDIINYCGTTLSITVTMGGVNIGTFQDVGHYEFTFTAITDNISFSTNTTATPELLWLDNVQIYEDFAIMVDDIVLPKELLKLRNVGASDYIAYFGDALQCLPCGQWYSIIQTGEALYFSEVITIKDFIAAKAPYVLLTWGNSCDIDDAMYTSENDNGDRYINKMWIDGPITKPEYPGADEGEDDGNGVLSLDFQKWEKHQTIIIPKAPEFIVDSTTAIRLHNEVTFTAPLRKNQLRVSDAVETERSESDIEYVFNDCAANVTLKMVLLNRVIDSSCCVDNSYTCITCSLFVFNINELNTEIGVALLIGYPDKKDGIYEYIEGVWTFSPDQKRNVCIEDDTRIYTQINGAWVLIPIIDSVDQIGTEFTIYGNGFPNTYVKVEVVWIDGTGTDPTQTYTLPTIYTVAQLQAGIVFDQSDLPFDPPICGQQRLRIHDYTINCDYGFSNAIIFNYYDDILCPDPLECDYDSDACAFFAVLEEDLSDDAKAWYNDIFEQLKSTGQWDAMDRLWIFGTNDAGITITEEAARTSLKNPVSSKAINNALVWDTITGYRGDGVSKYLDLQYDLSTDPVMASANDNGITYKINYDALAGAGKINGITGCQRVAAGPFTQYFARMADAPAAGIQHSLNASSISNDSYGGLGNYVHKRTSSSQTSTYKDGVLIANTAQTGFAFPAGNHAAFAVMQDGSPVDFAEVGLLYLGYGNSDLDSSMLTSILP